jgi:hypothetical protein
MRAGDNPRTMERSPFSDDELKRMFEAYDTQYGKRQIVSSRDVNHKPAGPGDNANYRYKWTGQDLSDFISNPLARPIPSII